MGKAKDIVDGVKGAVNDLEGFVEKAANLLDGKKEKENFSGGFASNLLEYFNKGYMFLQNNAIELEDIQLNLAKQLGTSRAQSMAIMGSGLDITTNTEIDKLFGFTADKYAKALANIQTNLGKKVGLSETGAKTFAEADSIFGDEGKTMSEISAAFLQVGSNMEAAGDTVAKMFSNAVKSGLSFQKISATVKSHLKEVNQYGFKNGIDGMRQMAEYAEQIGMDMSQVLRVSEKTSSLTGVTDVAAKLSVLGGNFQRLGNPLEMLNESLTDVESYQKRIGDMFKGMAKWDAKKGMISVSAVDRLRINEAASAMGLDKNEVYKSVETQARRDMIERQIGGGLADDIKNLVANIGIINKEGRAGVVDSKGQFRDVSEIASNSELREEIINMNRTSGETLTDISQSLISWKEQAINFYQMLVNRKTAYEFGTGGKQFEEARRIYSSELRDEHSPLNTIVGELSNVQKIATEGIEKFRGFVDNEFSSVVNTTKDIVTSVASLLGNTGVQTVVESASKGETVKSEGEKLNTQTVTAKTSTEQSAEIKSAEQPTVVVTTQQQKPAYIYEGITGNGQTNGTAVNSTNVNVTINPSVNNEIPEKYLKELSDGFEQVATRVLEKAQSETQKQNGIFRQSGQSTDTNIYPMVGKRYSF